MASRSAYFKSCAIATVLVAGLVASANSASAQDRPLGNLFNAPAQPVPAAQPAFQPVEPEPRRLRAPAPEAPASLFNAAPGAPYQPPPVIQTPRSVLPSAGASPPAQAAPARLFNAASEQPAATPTRRAPPPVLIRTARPAQPAPPRLFNGAPATPAAPALPDTILVTPDLRQTAPQRRFAQTPGEPARLFNPLPLEPGTPVTRARRQFSNPRIQPLEPRRQRVEPQDPSVRTADDEEPPVDITADQIINDEENQTITALGNVEVLYNERTLLTDKLSYNQISDVITAEGNVTLIDGSGEIVFADKIELSSDLNEAVAARLGVLLQDEARMAGAGARRVGGRVTTLHKGVYSACRSCPDHPDRPPLWRVKAVNVIHDQELRLIEYEDAWLEAGGIPIAYTPYFNHPDPTVRRKSGILTPGFGGSTDLGASFRLPYYYVIDEQSDVTLTPTYYSDAGLLGEAEYRRKFKPGELDVKGSIIKDDAGNNRELQGHVFAKGDFDINKTWRAGFDLERTTNDTFLRRFQLQQGPVLQTRLFAEGFRGRNYFSTEAFVFQNLRRTTDPLGSPNVLPLLEFSHVGEPDRFGGSFSLDANALALVRRGNNGNDTRRLSARPVYNLRTQSPFGGLYYFQTGLYADFFDVDNLDTGEAGKFSGSRLRLFPFASAEWRLPLASTKKIAGFSQTLTPIINVVTSPNAGNSNKIPNEDSQEFEFDDSNLFVVNRFSGIDRIEGGQRVNYGVEYGVVDKQGRSAALLVGQVYRFATDDTFAKDSGLSNNLSDAVVNLDLRPASFIDINHRTQLDVRQANIRRSELELSAGPPAFRLGVNHFFFESYDRSEFPSREEITIGARSQITRHWRANFNAVRDIEEQQFRRIDGSVSYEDECLLITARFARDFFRDREVTPSDSFTINFLLKTLGGVSQS